jgi:predicted permease
MSRIARDVRFALRGFRRTPGFFATAVAILALGIGMSVAMFTVFRAVLVRRLPVVDQDRVVVMWTYRDDPSADYTLGTKELSIVRAESKTMRDIAAVAHWPATPSPFRYGERSIQLERGMCTGNLFDLLGVRPALGRLMHASDDEVPGSQPGASKAPRALVLSYQAWRDKFGGDSSIIGQRLVEPLLQTAYTIVGVAPAGFDYPAHAEYWIPMWGGWQAQVSSFAVARLAPGASVTAARDEYLAIERRVLPDADLRGAHAATFTETVLGNVRPVLALLTGAVGLLLLIACLNVGTLVLLRASTRTREIAVRRALGAGFADVVRQLLVEALAIAAVGGVLGLALAIALLRLLVAYAPPNLPRLDIVQIAGTPVGIAIAVSTIAVLIFGLGPALWSARANLAAPLRLDSRAGGRTRGRRAFRQALVGAQMALAMIMLGGAALLARSLARLERQDTGFVSDHVSVFWYSWNALRVNTDTEMVALGDRVARRVRAIPGVHAATQMVAPPMLGNGVWRVRFQREGDPESDIDKTPSFPVEMAGSGFFDTFRIPILRGRAFTDDDRRTSPLVVIVSESAARELWPGQDALGKRVRLPGLKPAPGALLADGDWRTVVGIARDAHMRTLREASPLVYLPSLQGYWQGNIAIRSTANVSALLPALRRAGHDVDPELELWDPRTMDEVLDEPLAQPRLGALLMSSFGIVALLLAAIGHFGVMASLVRDRTREIGIRMALGATSARVRADVLGRAATIVGLGAAVGLLAALATSRVLTALLFQVSPTDPISLGVACIVLLGVAAAAAYLPARRATSIEPVEALRAD